MSKVIKIVVGLLVASLAVVIGVLLFIRRKATVSAPEMVAQVATTDEDDTQLSLADNFSTLSDIETSLITTLVPIGSMEILRTTRGFRNANPGNLTISKQRNWVGRVPLEQNTDGKFEQFTDLSYGIAAMMSLIKSKIDSGKSLVELIRPYAPSSDANNTSKYIKSLANLAGVTNVNADLVYAPTVFKGLIIGIIRLENTATITDAEYNEALAEFIKNYQ